MKHIPTNPTLSRPSHQTRSSKPTKIRSRGSLQTLEGSKSVQSIFFRIDNVHAVCVSLVLPVATPRGTCPMTFGNCSYPRKPAYGTTIPYPPSHLALQAVTYIAVLVQGDPSGDGVVGRCYLLVFVPRESCLLRLCAELLSGLQSLRLRLLKDVGRNIRKMMRAGYWNKSSWYFPSSRTSHHNALIFNENASNSAASKAESHFCSSEAKSCETVPRAGHGPKEL